MLSASLSCCVRRGGRSISPWFGPLTQKPRARSFAEFTLCQPNEILRFAQDDISPRPWPAQGQGLPWPPRSERPALQMRRGGCAMLAFAWARE